MPAQKVTPMRDQQARAISMAALFIEAMAETSGDDTMPMQQMQLLLQLYIHGQLAQQHLHKFTRVEKSANSRNVAKLGPGERPHLKAGPGFLESYEDPNDRRLKLVRLTPKGRAMLESAASKVAAFF